MSRRFIIDTDTASDDAVALIMAVKDENVTVDALTIVYGNCARDQASQNARYTLQLLNRTDIAVYDGCSSPLMRDVAFADWFHGKDGLGDNGYPKASFESQSENAVSELVKRFAAEPGQIELVTLGPLTNIATAIQLDENFAKNVKHCFVMGGSAACVGNVTPAAEFNIWCDPEAAAIVFDSGMKITMIGWELSRGVAGLDEQERDEIVAFGTPHAKFAIECNSTALEAAAKFQQETRLVLADPVAMAVALQPQNVPVRQSLHNVQIACDIELTRGMTVVDELHVTKKERNVNVVWEICNEKWKQILLEALKK